MKARKLAESSTFSEVRASTSSQTTASRGQSRGAAFSALAAPPRRSASRCPPSRSSPRWSISSSLEVGDDRRSRPRGRRRRGSRRPSGASAARSRKIRLQTDGVSSSRSSACSVWWLGDDDPQVDHRRLAYPRVLTDYHLHLRPDEPGRRRPSYFTERERRALPRGGARRPGSGSSASPSTSTASRDALDDLAPPVLGASRRRTTSPPTASSCASTPLRLGIEMDFVPGAEDRIAVAARRARLRLRRRLGPLRRRRRRRPRGLRRLGGGRAIPIEVWRRYFETLAEAARSGPLRHPRPPRPGQGLGQGPPAARARPALLLRAAVEAIAETGIAVEVSTAGLRKPVGELYPAPALAEMCVEAGAPFALSSDAHVPEHVGFATTTRWRRCAVWGIERDRGVRAPRARAWSRSG